MTGTETDSQPTPKIIDCSTSQADFVETPYEDQSWEIVGEVVDNQEFVPMNLQVVGEDDLVIDPMFANYGGLPEERSEIRWHLPENVAYQPRDGSSAQQEEVVDNSIKITPEELEALKLEAYEQGKAEGMALAVEERTEKFQTIEASILGLTEDMRTQMSEIIDRTGQQAVQLALAISKKLLDTAVEVNPEYIIEIINEALTLAGTASIQRVRVSPQDFEFIEVVGVRKHIQGFDNSWDFEPDATIRSGCIVDTSAGEIDYDLDEAWERIQDNVMKVIR